MRISAATAKKGMGSDGDGDFTASSESVPYGGYRGNRIRYARQSHGHKGMHAYHNPGAYASVRNSVFNTGGVGGGGGGGQEEEEIRTPTPPSWQCPAHWSTRASAVASRVG